MRNWIRILCAAAVLGGIALDAQQRPNTPNLDEYVALARKDVNTQKSQIIGNALQLSASESAAFWPVYKAYEDQLTKIGEARYAAIKDYAASYTSMTDAKANELADRAIGLEEQRLALMKRTLGEVRKVLPGIKAARWYQVEMGLNKIIDLQIASELPLVK